MVNNGNRTFLLLELILADQLADLPSPVEASSGEEWTLIHISTMLELIWEDQLADLPQVEVCSGQEWHFHISTVRAHIGRSTGRYLPPW